jgi:hypothetical protein
MKNRPRVRVLGTAPFPVRHQHSALLNDMLIAKNSNLAWSHAIYRLLALQERIIIMALSVLDFD